MIHPEYGLWHSYRFALLGDRDNFDPLVATGESPYLNCDAKPGLQQRPVDAIGVQGYDVERCASYLQQTPQAECHSRAAWPVMLVR